MRSKPVSALPEVEEDLKSAIAHYQSWRSDGKEHLLQKYDETINWIAWNPDLFPKKFGNIQLAILKHSYYLIYFVQEVERSLILAVLDARRNPTTIRRVITARRKN